MPTKSKHLEPLFAYLEILIASFLKILVSTRHMVQPKIVRSFPAHLVLLLHNFDENPEIEKSRKTTTIPDFYPFSHRALQLGVQ